VPTEFKHQLFDKVLVSDLQHLLLEQFEGEEVGDADVVKLTISPEVFEPRGDAVLDDSGLGLKILSDGSRSFFLFEQFSVVAVVDSSGMSVTLHPTDLLKPINLQTKQILDARVVTWVLSRLPILWGTPSIHGANMSFTQGSLLLLGKSGAGKSTLSQHLSRTFGASLHDDDTSLINLGTNPVSLVPMGAAARIRSDAAESMNLHGRSLPKYAGEKIALSKDRGATKRKPLSLRVIIEVVQLPESASGTHDGTPTLRRMTNGEAMLTVDSHLFRTDLSAGQRRLSFLAAIQLSLIPTWRLTYVLGSCSPEETARTIHDKFLDAIK
jgi:hypothetical protein